MRTLLAELFMGWVHPWVGLGGDVTARSQLSANTVESAEPLKWGAECGTPLTFILAANCELVRDV